MLSPRAVHLFLRNFDAIDQALTRKLMRKSNWDEETLTTLFCDLMDAEAQAEENVGYTQRQLHEDLARSDEPLAISLEIDTHKYPKHFEHWITQSDLGLIINYQDQLSPHSSVTAAWLLQAKRQFKTKGGRYEVGSRFKSVDPAQDAAMKSLGELMGQDFIRYFLYCPRPKQLKPAVREQLNHARTQAISGGIFDYTLGLELRDDLLSESPTTAAGLFVAALDGSPKTLLETHEGIFNTTTPVSWFIVEHLDQKWLGRAPRSRGVPPNSSGGAAPRPEVVRLVRGDHTVIESSDLPKSLGKDVAPKVLSVVTIEINVVCSLDRPRAK